jgi:hypothetical protein
MFTRTAARTANRLVETASAYLNYQAGPMMRTVFGETVGYNNQPWAGAFIDVCAREAGLDIPSCVYTPTALSVMLSDGRQRMHPKPGDLAFFNFPSENAGSLTAMPHVAIVTDVREFKLTGRFQVIEGNSRPANAKMGTGVDGVFLRIRNSRDVIAFVRPKPNRQPGKLRTKLIEKLGLAARVSTSPLEEAARANIGVVPAALAPKLRNKQIEVVQLALSVTVGLHGYTRGQWDSLTESAYATFQRRIGYLGQDANGVPNRPSLQRLASETNLFHVLD